MAAYCLEPGKYHKVRKNDIFLHLQIIKVQHNHHRGRHGHGQQQRNHHQVKQWNKKNTEKEHLILQPFLVWIEITENHQNARKKHFEVLFFCNLFKSANGNWNQNATKQMRACPKLLFPDQTDQTEKCKCGQEGKTHRNICFLFKLWRKKAPGRAEN